VSGSLICVRAAGLYGKLPSRGDFLRIGLPRSFTDPWDAWLQAAITASRVVIGEDWLGAYMEAAIWSFALGPGICGPDAVIGLWLPSVDRVGRHFPLTLAATASPEMAADLTRCGGGFLVAAEAAGLAALESDLAPEAVAARLRAAADAPPTDPDADAVQFDGTGALFWTRGGVRIPSAVLATDGLPPPAAYAAMLDARYRIDAS